MRGQHSGSHKPNLYQERVSKLRNDNSFDLKGFISLADWINYVKNGKLVLPMIQRGSVWAPHKILDLWDTLLRGMPIGAMMVSRATGTKIIRLLDRELDDSDENAISLIDGQQRTLAMISGWPEVGEKLQRAVSIWVDLGEEPQAEYRFRLLIATRSQPFGFANTGVGGKALSKLSSHERRLANLAYSRHIKEGALKLWNDEGYMPWHGHFAVSLAKLISKKDTSERKAYVETLIDTRIEAFAELAATPIGSDDGDQEGVKITAEVQEKIRKHFKERQIAMESFRPGGDKRKELEDQCEQLFGYIDDLPKLEFPLIPVQHKFIQDVTEKKGDPTLAILFKRVGTGGQALSNADYVYAVIKQIAPDAHELVESFFETNEAVTAIFHPTDLVMSAVRLTLLNMPKSVDGGGKQAPKDRVRIDKAEFAKLVSKSKNFGKDFNSQIGPNGQYRKKLASVLSAISYSDKFKQGLPRHALSALVDQSMLDVLLAWAYQSNDECIESSKLAMVRFLLWGYFCLKNKDKASELSIALVMQLTQEGRANFPDADIVRALVKDVAYTLPSPEQLAAIPGLIYSEGLPIRGRSRFDLPAYQGLENAYQQQVEVYKRWWNRRGGGHFHPILLWLQRDYVFTKFNLENVLVGMEDETPYDFDHILAYSHWGDWTGSGTPPVLKSIEGDTSPHWIGNAMGNIRVWSSQDNRSDGSDPPSVKLLLESGDQKMHAVLAESVIAVNQIDDWQRTSGKLEKPRDWDVVRASAFQRVVEQRTFDLYKRFYADLELHVLN